MLNQQTYWHTDGQLFRYNDSLTFKCNKGVFKHYISLGFCCHMAGNLEKMGLRSASMPYDWNVTYWRAIEDTIRSHFDNYLVKEKLFQFKNNLHCYENCSAGVSFVHDFVDYLPLDKQFEKVEKKYHRRIKAFYSCIAEPTVFIRYCMNADEVFDIENRYQEIRDLFIDFNPQSELIFLTHDNIDFSRISNIENLFVISKDENERESTTPIIGCETLYSLLNNAKYDNRKDNLEFYMRKHDSSTIKKRIEKKFTKIKKITQIAIAS